MSQALAPLPFRSHRFPAGVHSSREFELVLAATSCQSDTDRSAQIGVLISKSIDWAKVIALAAHHGVIPVVHTNLAVHVDEVPPQAFQQLAATSASSTRQALWLTSLLGKALDALESHGVRALPYKGPVLSKTLYGDVARRQFSDLDILVRPADVPQAKQALTEIGCQHHLALVDATEQAYIACGYEHSFDGFGQKSVLELQWRILPRFYSVDFDIDSFFQRAHTLILNERQVQTLSPEDLVLVLCVHAAKHLWGRLSWICDIADLAASAPCDWEQVLHEARVLGVTRILGISFFLAEALLNAAIPSPLQTLRIDRDVQLLGKDVLSEIFESVDGDTEALGYFCRIAGLRERNFDKVCFFTRLALTPGVSEWSLVRLPAPLSPLYRVIRLFRLLIRRLA